MSWIEITIIAKNKYIDEISEILTYNNYGSFWVDEKIEILKTNDGYDWKINKNEDSIFKIYEELSSKHDSELSIREEIKIIEKLLANRIKGTDGRFIENEDWSNQWKNFHKSIEISNDIIIYPNKKTEGEKDYKYKIYIEPGSAFGTGIHETTQQCMKIINNFISKGTTVLDIGAGSGILSIFSSMCGADNITAIDNNIDAKQNIKKNMELNNIKNIDIIINDINKINLPKNSFDTIILNIGSDIAIQLANNIERCVNENGTIIISGIVEWRLDEVIECYKKHSFKILEISKGKSEWITFAAKHL